MNKLKCFIKYILVLTALAGVLTIPTSAVAQDDEGEVSVELTPANKNAIFDAVAKYTFEVKNSTTEDQLGKVSYIVTTPDGEKVKEDSMQVKIVKKGAEKYNFSIPQSKPGFYKINVMINVSYYDDTVKKAFGIRPEQIKSEHERPKDFDEFWQKVKDELAGIDPDFQVTPMPEMDKDNRHVYLIEMKSLDSMTIRGWMTVPILKNPKKKFSVLLGLPGYQVNLDPLMGIDDDLAIITLNVRGQGNSRGPIDTRKDEFIFYHVENKDRYVMRGVIADCLRAVDFIFSRPELKHDNILVSGGSMGGFLALATASLDSRIRLCSAQNPILCDIRNLVGAVDWPISSIQKYVATQPGLTMDKVLGNLDYFDVKNFMPNITCSVLMGIGSLDPFAPPANEFAAYNNIKSNKRMMVFKDLAHEISQSYKDFEGRWMRDTFALF
ncbi:alpha/beta fold hydrolase [Mucilaginibacter calamicampi]|uniref:Alpha/beta fold hydrolase n=1 Tax=Mucilaginibacter calamicampi TaxID=1302352 RepID=A0ABW2Z5I4_9SPHI